MASKFFKKQWGNRHGGTSQTVTTTVPASRTEPVTLTLPVSVTYRVRLSTTIADVTDDEAPQPKSIQVNHGETTIGQFKKSIAKEFDVPAVKLRRQDLSDNDIVTTHIEHDKGILTVDIDTLQSQPASPPVQPPLSLQSSLVHKPVQPPPPLPPPQAPKRVLPVSVPATAISDTTPASLHCNNVHRVAENKLDGSGEHQLNLAAIAVAKDSKVPIEVTVERNHATTGRQQNINVDNEGLIALLKAGVFTREELLPSLTAGRAA